MEIFVKIVNLNKENVNCLLCGKNKLSTTASVLRTQSLTDIAKADIAKVAPYGNLIWGGVTQRLHDAGKEHVFILLGFQ